MIDPNNITTIRVGQLAAAPFNLTDNLPHEVGTELKRGTLQELADFISNYIGSTGGVGYLPISVTDGQQLPDVPAQPGFFLCGKGTFLNVNGYPDIVCTEELNAIMSVVDHWEIAVAIPIEVDPVQIGIIQDVLAGVVDKAPSSDAVYNALLLKQDLIVGQPQLVANMKSDWQFDPTGTKYPQHELVRKAIISSVVAFGCSGLIKRDDSIRLVDLNSTTLRVTANDYPFMFYNLLLTDYANALKSFPQIDFPLANIPDITTNGTFIRYVAYDINGVLTFSNNSFFEDDNYCQLGRILIKRVAGVITFADTVPSTRNVKTSPDIAGYNNLLRLYAPLKSNVECKPNASMTMLHAGGSIEGMSIDWGMANPNTRTVLAQNPVSFSYVSPLSNSTSTPPVATTLVTTNVYWNGTAVVAIPANVNATVQRIMISDNGTIVIQYGEKVYDNFAEAKSGASVAPFTPILPKASFTEIGRIIAQKDANNLQDEAKVQFIATSGASGGGGGTASAGTDIGVTLSATQALITSSTGLDGLLPLATSTLAGLLGSGAQTIYGIKTFESTVVLNTGKLDFKNLDNADLIRIERASTGWYFRADSAQNPQFASLTGGNIRMTKTGGIAAVIDIQSVLTTTKTFVLPNKDGTFALTSDIPSNPITGTVGTLQMVTATGVLGNSNIIQNASQIIATVTDYLSVKKNLSEVRIIGRNFMAFENGFLGNLDFSAVSTFFDSQFILASQKQLQLSNFSGTKNSFIKVDANNNLSFLVNTNILALTIPLTGNVLIGPPTDNGVDKLQVNGTVSGSNATLSNQFVTLGQTLGKITEGANTGFALSYDRSFYGNIGLNAVDLSYNDSVSTVWGATGEMAFAMGSEVIASGYQSVAFGAIIDNGGKGSFDTGFNLKDRGYTNFLTGIGHDVTGMNVTVIGQAADIINQSITDFNVATDLVFAVGSGTIQNGDNTYTVLTRSTALQVDKLGQTYAKLFLAGTAPIKLGSVGTFYTTVNDPLGGAYTSYGQVHVFGGSTSANNGGTISLGISAGGLKTGVKLHARKQLTSSTDYKSNFVVEISDGTNMVEGFRVKYTKVVNFATQTFADNAAALGGGLVTGDFYKTATGEIRTVI